MDGREPFNGHSKIGPIFRQKKHHEKQQSTSVTSTLCYMSSPPRLQMLLLGTSITTKSLSFGLMAPDIRRLDSP